MFNLHTDPTLSEVVGALIALLAICSIAYLAIDGSAAAQTALVSVAGAAAGTYYASSQNGNGKNGKTKDDATTVPPVVKPSPQYFKHYS